MEVKETEAKDRESWRAWLAENHDLMKNVWLIMYKKESGIPSVTYEEAVEEALCFGWIDSKPNKRDDQSWKQFFAKRNVKSNWSGKNKKTVERLLAAGKMAPAGLEMIEIAKANGTWNALDEVEKGIIPPDLQAALAAIPKASQHFDAFPPSVRRSILEWILNAKRPETRAKRIKETAELAGQNKRANQYPRQK